MRKNPGVLSDVPGTTKDFMRDGLLYSVVLERDCIEPSDTQEEKELINEKGYCVFGVVQERAVRCHSCNFTQNIKIDDVWGIVAYDEEEALELALEQLT